MADRSWSFLAIVVLLAACQATPTATVSVEEFEVALVSPSWRTLATQWLEDFNQQTGQVEINLNPVVYSVAIETLEDSAAAIYITSQPPPAGWWATPLGSEAIAVVTHGDNPVDDLTRSELVQIISGQITSWEPWTEESTPLEVVFPIAGDEMRSRFLDQLSSGVRLSPNARLAADPAMVAEFVADTPGRIGIMPFSLVDSSLNLVRIDGLRPDDEDYPFNIQILAIAPEEPAGAVRQWLVWLQDHLGISQLGPTEPGATPSQEPITPSPSRDDSPSSSTPPPTRTPSASETEEG